MATDDEQRDFGVDCMRERGRILTGLGAHYCHDWDGLTMDETCIEWNTCTCFPHPPTSGPGTGPAS